MCGRFQAKIKIPFKKSIWEILGIPAPEPIENPIEYKQLDVRPTNQILILRKDENGKVIYDVIKWGMMVQLGGGKVKLVINSTIENIKIKPTWKKLITQSPCLIPMSAFYEWKDLGGKEKKQPHKFTIKDQDIFFAAGYYRTEKDVKTGEPITAGVIITTIGNDITRLIHPKDRSPVIINPKYANDYLNSDFDLKVSLCEPPCPAEEMEVVEEAP